MIALISAALTFLNMLFKEYFSSKAAAAVANQEFKVDQAKFQEMAAKVLDKMRTDAAAEKHQADDVDGQVDRDESSGKLG